MLYLLSFNIVTVKQNFIMVSTLRRNCPFYYILVNYYMNVIGTDCISGLLCSTTFKQNSKMYMQVS